MITAIASNTRRLTLLRQITDVETQLAELYAKLALEPTAAETQRDRIFEAAIRIAARQQRVNELQLLSRARTRDIADARFLAMWLVSLVGLSATDIGRHFDRNHAMVLIARTRIENLRDCYPEMRVMTEEMKAEFLKDVGLMIQTEMPLESHN